MSDNGRGLASYRRQLEAGKYSECVANFGLRGE
jgi:hypothetical protein